MLRNGWLMALVLGGCVMSMSRFVDSYQSSAEGAPPKVLPELRKLLKG